MHNLKEQVSRTCPTNSNEFKFVRQVTEITFWYPRVDFFSSHVVRDLVPGTSRSD